MLVVAVEEDLEAQDQMVQEDLVVEVLEVIQDQVRLQVEQQEYQELPILEVAVVEDLDQVQTMVEQVVQEL